MAMRWHNLTVMLLLCRRNHCGRRGKRAFWVFVALTQHFFHNEDGLGCFERRRRVSLGPGHGHSAPGEPRSVAGGSDLIKLRRMLSKKWFPDTHRGLFTSLACYDV